MDGTEDGRQIVVDSCYEGQARSRRQIRCGGAYGVYADQQCDWQQHPSQTEPLTQCVQAIHESLQTAYGTTGQGDEQSGGSADVSSRDDNSAHQNRPGNGPSRVLDFVAHGAAGFNAAKREEDPRPEHGIIKRPVRGEARNGEVGGGSELMPRDDGHDDEQSEWQEASNRAHIVQAICLSRLHEC